MSNYIISFKDGTSADVISKAKADVVSAGGKITSEFTLIPAFAATLPEGQVSVLSSNPDVSSVEQDGEVRIQ